MSSSYQTDNSECLYRTEKSNHEQQAKSKGSKRHVSKHNNSANLVLFIGRKDKGSETSQTKVKEHKAVHIVHMILCQASPFFSPSLLRSKYVIVESFVQYKHPICCLQNHRFWKKYFVVPTKVIIMHSLFQYHTTT